MSDRYERIARPLRESKFLVYDEEQLLRMWPESTSGRKNGRKQLDEMVADELLGRIRLETHPLLPLVGPLYEREPGDPFPDTGSIAYQCQRRWGQARPSNIYFLSRRAVRLFGSLAPGRLVHPQQASHDKHVTEIYLKYAASRPEIAAAWLGEAAIADERRGQKLPDAVLFQGGFVTRVIEFGGCYPKSRISSCIEDAESRGLPIEIW